ncbi:MAG: hypothetical protein ACRD4O_12170, partial [Bryobacteraceae bacterium]
MSAAAQTKIFGIRVGLNPKVIVIALLAIAGLLFWYNSRGGGEEGAGNTAARTQTPASTPVSQTWPAAVRRGAAASRGGVLSVRKIDPTRGDIDPTLRLDLLARLQRIELGAAGRDIFETGPSPAALAAMAKNIRGPVIPPKPVVSALRPAMAAGRPMVSIPLKYYGFVKPADRAKPNRGFFLDGDNVLVAS